MDVHFETTTRAIDSIKNVPTKSEQQGCKESYNFQNALQVSARVKRTAVVSALIGSL